MQEHTFQPLLDKRTIQRKITIFFITGNRVSHRGAMHTNLVCSPRTQLRFQQAEIFPARQQTKYRVRRLAQSIDTHAAFAIALCTVLANIEVAVLIKAFGMEQTLGNTLFTSSFLATDFLSEFYGKKEAGKAVKIGIATSCVFILFSSLWPHYAPASGDRAMAAVKTLFSGTPRILASSLIAYAVSELLDVRLYHAL